MQVENRTNDNSSIAYDDGRRSPVECHLANGQSSVLGLTRRGSAFDENIFPSSDDLISSVNGTALLQLNNCDLLDNSNDSSRVGTSATDTQSRTTIIRQTEDVQTKRSSVSTSRCLTSVHPSPRSAFGRRRRPVSVMESTCRVLTTPPPPLPRPLGHIRSQVDRARTNDTAADTVCNDDHVHQPTMTRLDQDLMLCDDFTSDTSKDYSSVASRSSTSTAVTRCTDMTSMNCDYNTCNSMIRSSNEATSVNRPKLHYETSTAGPHANDADQSGVYADVGSLHQQQHHLNTFHERSGHNLQPNVPVNSTVCTAAERDSCSCDVTNRNTRPSALQQDSLLNDIPPLMGHISEIDVLTKFSESLAIENDESTADVNILLPPPPEFDDRSITSVPDCFTAPVCQSNLVRNSNIDSWPVDDVCNWLDAVGLFEHCASFTLANINGTCLKTLGRAELIALGLTDVHDRMKFERALRKVSNS